MAPSDYEKVRTRARSNDPNYSEIVDGRLYFPFLIVDSEDEESIKHVAITFIQSMNTESDLSIRKVCGGNTNTLYRVSKVTGGITNQLYKVDIDEPAKAVLVRIFGAPGLIDRDVENSVYAALAERGIAPPYHGRFANGRVEAWLDMRPMEVPELGNFAIPIAEKLARLHVEFVPDQQEEPTMWKQLRSWMDQALMAKFRNETDEEKAMALNLDALPAELDWLQGSVVPTDSPIAFCHNDLLAANVMVTVDLQTIQLIDFEYGGSNYIAFDIANHFNEYAGGTDNGVPNYDLFPSQKQQWKFVHAYLRSVNQRIPSASEVGTLLSQVQAFVLVNHLYWGLWAVNQASSEGCANFDYLLYATNRIGRYRSTKL